MTLTLLIKRFYHEAWNSADNDCAREILHPDFDFRASLGPTRTGPEGFIRYMDEVRAGLPDFQCNIIDIVDAGHKAAARMSFVGTHQGDFFGVKGTQRRIEWAGGAFFKSDGRQITALWVLGDIDTIKHQLGVTAGNDFLNS